jgi:putative pre-16S rRNA nuclease
MSKEAEKHKNADATATIMAVDYGRARIGLAISAVEAQLPRPLLTLERVNRNEDMRRLRELAREHSVRQIVVGLPLRLDGTRGEMAEEATRFAARLNKQLGIPVDMIDERLSSWGAERLLEEQSGRVLHDAKSRSTDERGSSRASVDAVAAAVILKEYLEQKHATKSDPQHI